MAIGRCYQSLQSCCCCYRQPQQADPDIPMGNINPVATIESVLPQVLTNPNLAVSDSSQAGAAPAINLRTRQVSSSRLQSPITRFFSGETRTPDGYSIDEIHRFDSDKLERVHSFIQWLFPTDKPSDYNSSAPIVTHGDRVELRQHPELKAVLLKSLKLMLKHWGLELIDECTIASRVPFSLQTHRWLNTNNHNQLRISRVTRSLMLFDCQQLAESLSSIVLAGAAHVNSQQGMTTVPDRTMQFWATSHLPDINE